MKHSSPRPALFRLLPAALGSLALGAGVGAYSLLWEPFQLELTHTDLFLPRLPHTWNGLRVLFLSDPHVIHWSRREDLLLRMLETIGPVDLVVWGGDYLQGGSGPAPSLRLVEAVNAPFVKKNIPIYAVLGNAEHKMNYRKRARYIRELEKRACRVLMNRHESLTLRGETATIAGVDDPYYGHADLAAALQNAPEDRFTLLVSHSPQLAVQAACFGIDLMLSGHTHGGQVRLPIIGPLKTQNPLARKMDCGVWNRARLSAALRRDVGGDTVTFISRGIGVANFPRLAWLTPRFLCRPEVAVLTLRRGSEN